MSRFAHTTKIAAVALAGVTLVSVLPTPSEARNNTAGAVAAGVVGGLIVGGLAASAANNYYAPPPPQPAYGPRPGYGPAYAYGPGYSQGYGQGYGYRRHRPHCWMQTQTFYNRWGRPYYQDVEVCR